MPHSKPQYFLALSLVVLIVLAAWFMQATLLLNWDVSWDLLAAKRLLAGGTYTNDFFDLNPPLTLYLYIPAVLLVKMFSLSSVIALRIYVFGLALFSLYICYLLGRAIFFKKNSMLAYACFVMLTVIFLILPGSDFGEREHLLFILTMPYFLIVSYRLQGKSLYGWYAVGIGLFVAVGFALKPYFLIPLILVETYVVFYTRNLWAWVRVEVITILVFLVVYAAFIVIFYADYITVVVPLAMRYYYASYASSWGALVANYLMYFCGIAILFYLVQYKKNPYKELSAVFLLALLGFVGCYLLQRTAWAYHIFPAVATAWLMITLLCGLFIIQQEKYTMFPLLLAAFLFIIPVVEINTQYMMSLSSKKHQEPLIKFLRAHAAQQPVYFISATPREIFPMVDEAHAIYASRLLHLFWMPGFVKNSRLNMKFSPQQVRDERFFINLIAEDIEIKKPKFVLVDVKEYKSAYLLNAFEYLPYFLQNKYFQSVWQPYHYLTTIEVADPKLKNLPVYKYQIYQRTFDS